ncbi:methyltransferase domain-containing protein [Cellulomonas fimi]|uniref:class I SAM-dependent methyltransferase n=1 Tax=Cellulomonas fimi TaxID=1708 RepID=UPI00234D184C|nr:methyltransferase domain-containing protein [Cellulomonas fimi]MDC7122260.1 methyltransferase domain-containing protein [Cellulomonas fimi]
MPDPTHFDGMAELYDRARPPYPDALWGRLRDLALLGPGTRVLELGAGSGLATAPMVAAGAEVTAVEPGPALADLLRRRVPDATVLAGTAESVALDAAAFDLAVAATAVHWFDLDVVLPRLHHALVPGGHLAVWRHVFGDPAVPRTPFRERVEQIVRERGDVPPRPGPTELDTAGWVDRLTAGGWFAVRHVEELRWSVEVSARQVRDLFRTFSEWTAAEADAAGRAVEDLGGRVTEHYVTPLLVLRRAEVPGR